MLNAVVAQGGRAGVSGLPYQVLDRKRKTAEALAGRQDALPTQRNAAQGQSLRVRAVELVWDLAIALALCVGLFWIVREVMAIWG